ncbi:hypothetical protein DM02DRAFT_108897 [Periconia macrospinosa]|uniref:Extracellular membrane protein CFEM domain-containing protein n=1 Tax=Periconia macrospinosa TaxID=97972 RepID=A0A2V1E799_9PLEO|nr:hypothetical protein DM02DRAFT_108897 [Periconia macrospinosa]
MVATARITMALMAVGVTLATQSISLSNFTPRIENLPNTCQNAYTSAIQGCTKDDFASNARCSASCIQGLTRITTVVTQNCKGVNVPETSIIGVFLLNKGVEALCPSARATSSAASSPPPSSTQPAPPPPATTSSSSQAQETPDSSSAPPPESTASSSSSTQPASPLTPTSTELAASSSNIAPPQLSTAPGSAPPVPSQTESPQRSSQNSGGGSPFDIGASALAPQVRLSSFTLLGMVALTMVSTTVL